MTLKPRQIIGLVAIVVFGAILIWRFTQPSERDVMAQRIASLPSLNATVPMPDLPPITLPSTTGAGTPTTSGGGAGSDRPIWELSGIDHFNLGSQAAKDDLYCGGVLNAEFEVVVATAHPDKASMVLRDAQALEAAGVAKLKAEGHATDQTWAGFTLAYDDKAKTDYADNALRLSVAECTARAAALAGAEN